MPEGAPRFEIFRTPERGDTLHSPELAPDDSCGAQVDIVVSPLAKGEDGGFNTSGQLSCVNCPVEGSFSSNGWSRDEATERMLYGVRKTIKEECVVWKLHASATLTPDAPMPDSFLPKELRPSQ